MVNMRLYKYPEQKDKMPDGNYYLYEDKMGWLTTKSMWTGHIDSYAELVKKCGDNVSYCYGPEFDPKNLPDPTKEKTVVVSAFPGTGKSHAFKNLPKNIITMDSDSSNFSWVNGYDEFGNEVKIRNKY